jgi:hypothetical protein
MDGWMDGIDIVVLSTIPRSRCRGRGKLPDADITSARKIPLATVDASDDVPLAVCGDQALARLCRQVPVYPTVGG